MSVVTLLFSSLLIKLIGFLVDLMPASDVSTINNFMSVTVQVTNVFSWAQQFLPVSLIVFLFSLTMVCYAIKFLLKVGFLIIKFFK